MSELSNLYEGLWQKYRPALISLMKQASEEPQKYQLSKHEFTSIGDRAKAKYSFRLEIKNAKALNTIQSSAIARDLLKVLNQSPTAIALSKDKVYVFRLDTNFILHISLGS